MSGSYYTLDAKYNTLQAEIDAIIAGGGGGGSQNLASVLAVGNSAGATDINMNARNILACNNLNVTTINSAAYPPVVAADNLQAVLDAGNTANGANASIGLTSGTNVITINPTATTGQVKVEDGAGFFAAVEPNVIKLNRPVFGASPADQLQITDDNVSYTIGGGGLNATWANIINAANASGIPTYDQVLNSGNTATDKNAVITGTGGIGTITNTTNKGSISFIETDGSVINQTSLLYTQGLTITDQTNALFSYFRSVGAYIGNITATIYSTLTNSTLSFYGSPVSNSYFNSSALVINDTNAGAAGSTLQASNLYIQSPLTGYTSQPNITLTNGSSAVGSATGVPSIETYKFGRNATANDIISSQHFYAKNYAGTKTEFARIEGSVRATGLNNDDGALAFLCATQSGGVNVFQEFMRLNGADNENNFFRPLDMNNNAIKTSSGDLTLTTSVANSDIAGTTTDGNISWTANTGAGGVNGFCFLTADRGVGLTSAIGGSDGNIILDVNNIGDLQLQGTTLQSATSGGNSGQHLRIKLNGTYYKIALQND